MFLLGSKNEEHASYKQYLKKLIMKNISDVVSSRPAVRNWPKKVCSSKTCINTVNKEFNTTSDDYNKIFEAANLIRKKNVDPVDTGRKLNAHKTFRRRPGRLLNALCTFNLRPLSTRDRNKNVMNIQSEYAHRIDRRTGSKIWQSMHKLMPWINETDS